MCLSTKISPDFTYPDGLLFAVYNSLAQLANRAGEVAQSVAYLEAGIEYLQDSRVKKDDFPLAETFLNIANAQTFLNKFESGVEYASKAIQHST